MAHPEMLVRVSYLGFDGPGNAGENQPAATRHSTHDQRRHLDQWSGQNVRDDKRPQATYNVRSAADELQAVSQVIEARILSRDSQRIGVSISRPTPLRHAQYQRRQCENARSRADIEDACDALDREDLFQSLNAQCRGWMMSGSKSL